MSKINQQALYADETASYRIPLEPEAGERVTLRFRTAKDDVDRVFFICGEERKTMEKVCSRGRFDYFEIEEEAGTETSYYFFEIRSGEERLFYNKRGVTDNLQTPAGADPLCGGDPVGK